MDQMQQVNEDVVEVPAAAGNGAAPRLQWTAAMSGFILRRFSDLVAEGVRTDKVFKDCHVNQVAHMLSEFTGMQVSATQVYNHLRKWRARWVKSLQAQGIEWSQLG